jgi:pimeloyl-ACP methyl ester carboxylesterase
MNESRLLAFLLLIVFVSLPLAGQTERATSSPVELTVSGGSLHGTLLVPENAGQVPVALLIAGSGPTDRNGNSAMLPGMNNSLRLLAEGLADKGIASVRYDKRGIAESAKAMKTEGDLRFETYVGDAVAWCTDLQRDKRFSRVVIVGHSEGSLIGMLAAKECRAAGFVSIAGAGRSAADTIRRQIAAKLPPDLAAKSENILHDLEQGKTSADVPVALMALYRPSVQPYLVSWFRYDPAKVVAGLSIPLLIVQGTTDIQVGVDDAKRLAAASPKAKLLVVEGMNHVLKSVPADFAKQIASYSDPSLPLASELVPAIVDLVRPGT